MKNVDKYHWSSHQGHLSDAKKWGWLYKDFVLSLFSDDKRLGRKRYREFVSRESAEEISVILGKKKLPAMLGSKGFIERMRQMFSVEKRHVEVPESRSLTPDVRKIRAVVCKSYNVTEEALTATRRGTANEARNVAIYLMRYLSGDSLEEIAREFRAATYISVSSVIERTKAMIVKDRVLRHRVEELKEEIYMSQEQTSLQKSKIGK